jgi:hypothetical protein
MFANGRRLDLQDSCNVAVRFSAACCLISREREVVMTMEISTLTRDYAFADRAAAYF